MVECLPWEQGVGRSNRLIQTRLSDRRPTNKTWVYGTQDRGLSPRGQTSSFRLELIILARFGRIWSVTSDEFKKIIDESESFRDALKRLGLCAKGGSNKALHERIKEEGIDPTPLYERGEAARKRHLRKPTPTESMLVEHSQFAAGKIRKRIIEEKLLDYVCAICGQPPAWHDEPLTLALDHINGVSDDMRLENLRFLCPNCHSQTPTFCRSKRERKIEKHCKRCGAPICKGTRTGLCRECADFLQRKAGRPPVDYLIQRVEEVGYRQTGRECGVTDNAIRKWIRIGSS